MRYRRLFKSFVVWAVSITLTSLPWYGAAQAQTSESLKNAASQAKDMSGDIVSAMQNNSVKLFGEKDTFTPQASVSDKNPLNASEVEKLMGIHTKETEYAPRGEAYKQDLYKRSQTADSRDPDAAAYAVVQRVHNLPKDVIKNDDPLFKSTSATLENINDIAANFADCKRTMQYFEGKDVVHVPELEQCTRVIDRSGTCELRHDYVIGALDQYDTTWGEVSMRPDGDGQMIVWIGQVGDNYWSGNCTLYEHFTRAKVANPNAILKAVVEYAKWDDYMQIWVGINDDLEKVWQGPNGTDFPYREPETGQMVGTGKCELSTSWERNISVDVTDKLRSAKAGDLVVFKIRASVSGNGEAYARMRVWFEPSAMITKDEWREPACLQNVAALKDGFAQGSVQCTSIPPLDANGCTTANGVKVCADDFKPSPYPGLSPFCKRATVSTNFNFYKGKMDCFIDAQGNKQCFENNGGNLDTCKDLEDSGCVYISGECTDGAQGESGSCYVYTNTYDCGYDKLIDKVGGAETTECSGALACMGEECIEVDKTKSADFTRTAALLNAAQQAPKDMVCTGVDSDGNPIGDSAVECTIFGGEAQNCKVAVGGVQDCCEKPKNISAIDYIITTISVYKADSAVMSLQGQEGNFIGAYQELHNSVTNVISQGFSTVSKPFASYVENISGAVDSIVTPVQEAIAALKQALKDKITDMLATVIDKMGITGSMAETAGSTASSQASAAATEAAQGIVNAIGTAVAVVGYIYAAYCAAMMIIQAVWKCTNDEYELASNRALKQCHYVGSYCKKKVLGACIEKRHTYCCYKSPLARILQEQIRGINGTNFGTAKNPQCTGLTIEEFTNIDWNQVNLDEWIALMQEAGEFGGNVDKLSMEAITGKGSALDVDGNRLNAAERAVERTGGADIDSIRQGIGNKMEVDMGKSP